MISKSPFLTKKKNICKLCVHKMSMKNLKWIKEIKPSKRYHTILIMRIFDKNLIFKRYYLVFARARVQVVQDTIGG